MDSMPLLECVPNLSEGRRPAVINRIVSAFEVPGVTLLDVHLDADHNRSVLTVAGHRRALVDAVIAATARAVEEIDLRSHSGVHPRMGAMDVVPFVPISGSEMAEAAVAAREAAQRINSELEVPCFLYGAAAQRQVSEQLPQVRREAFRTLTPDFGGTEPHATAGATVVGAREILVAYNINLDCPLEIAEDIASEIRERDGGLAHLRAMGVRLNSRNLSQVSMNLIRPAETTVADAYDAVQLSARERGVRIVEAELVGLAPRIALAGRDPYAVGLNSPPKTLEDELAKSFGG
ncbi:MAG: glutamate formimidoyltransferase [Actinomycetota bacterium]